MEHVLTMANLKLKPSLFTPRPSIYVVCEKESIYPPRPLIPFNTLFVSVVYIARLLLPGG